MEFGAYAKSEGAMEGAAGGGGGCGGGEQILVTTIGGAEGVGTGGSTVYAKDWAACVLLSLA